MSTKKPIKISLITTEYNEIRSIDLFIDSALRQTKIPDEIVIADAGSTDGTQERIKERIKNGDPITLVIARGNRSVGRNAAVKAAKNEFIAVTDVGCRLEPDWLEQITKPFSEGADIVAGYFQPEPKTYFEKVSSILMTDDSTDIDIETWLPSSRSIAFTKTAWAKAGGYPEYSEFGDIYIARMCGGEDTLYDMNLKKAGYTFADGLKAIAHWRPRPNLKEFARQYWMYSVGDGIRLVDLEHFKKLILKYSILFFFVPWLSFINIIMPIIVYFLFLLKQGIRVRAKWSKVGGLRALGLMMLLITVYDISQAIGFTRGHIARRSLPKDLRMVG